MKVLFVCLHAPEQAPGQRFRFEQYLPYLAANGIECTYSNLLEEKDYNFFYKKGFLFKKAGVVLRGFLKRYRQLKKINGYDIVFIQREAIMLGTWYFERQYAKKAKVIFDYDDATWLEQISGTNRMFKFLKDPGKTKEIIRISNLVFAGNKYLAAYAEKFNKNVVIVPTTIDTDEYKPADKIQKEKVCIGWSGSFSTIVHFQTCLEALKIIKNQYGSKIYFKVIGDDRYVNEELEIKGQAWKKDTEVKDLQEMDIGIMPLPDDEWAKGKCGLKGLQYMALSIPTIMSPVGVNTEIIDDGKNGFLASTTDEWVNKLSRLIETFQLREDMGRNGRDTVVKSFSVEANQKLYMQYLTMLHIKEVK
jgi:glycosyltransferase involved in cell wall biosynthesis